MFTLAIKFFIFLIVCPPPKVPPEVSVFLGRVSSSVVCHATGFYPKEINMTLKRDGEEMQEDVYMGETLPNGDGTHQKRAELTVSPEERKRSQYTCEVEHASGLIIKTLTEPGWSSGEMAEAPPTMQLY